MYVLGLNAYHADSSACLFEDGELVSAVEEERFLREKHWAGCPVESIRYCLEEAGITLNQVAHIAINSDPRSNIWRKLFCVAKGRNPFELLANRIRHARSRWAVVDALSAADLPGEFKGRLHRINHHLSHLASAYLVSPYGQAVCVSVDGFGDFSSAAWGLGRNGDLRVDGEVHYPHSLGVFYQAMTQYLGFPNYGDEYKVMGLAAYGDPAFMSEMRYIARDGKKGMFELNLAYFRHHAEGFEYRWEGGRPVVGQLFSDSIESMLGRPRQSEAPLEQRHKDVARSVQERYEEVFFRLLRTLHHRYGVDELTLAGGCAMNSMANGKIYECTPFKRVYVQAAPGDAGGAVGAAAWVAARVARPPKRFCMEHAYWGPEYSDRMLAEITQAHRAALDRRGCDIRFDCDQSVLLKIAAEAVSEGKVIGWFQGRMEWGPRALGNRSIICDPRRADMKEILNQKIKRRESFRPFAPSVLRDHVSEWFETDGDVPFMTQVFRIREEKRESIPAVTHVDGSGRLQTVTRQSNERYFGLIEEFYALTGIPMVLNTSFNENEPIVCTPEQAIECYLRTDMDWLVLGSQVISRA